MGKKLPEFDGSVTKETWKLAYDRTADLKPMLEKGYTLKQVLGTAYVKALLDVRESMEREQQKPLEICPLCNRLAKDCTHCGIGGCPMGGDL